MGKLSLLIGFGAGYVLGAKAGTERYDQIVATVRDLAGRPEVQKATHAVSQQVAETAADLGEKAKATAGEAAAGVAAKVTGGGGSDAAADGQTAQTATAGRPGATG